MTKALIRLFIKNAEDTRSAAVREQYGILSGAVGSRAICSCSRSN